MLKSIKLFQPRLVSPLLGGFVPNQSISTVDTNNNNGWTRQIQGKNVNKANTYSTSATAASKASLPDPSKAIVTYKAFHYGTMLLAPSLLVSLLVPASGLTMCSDVLVGLSIPLHMVIGMNSVINDYVYNPVLRGLSKFLIYSTAGITAAGLFLIAFKEGGLGAIVHSVYKSK